MKKIKELFNKKSFLMISLLIVIQVLITLITLVPNDYWWHVKAGEYIVNNKSIPFTDVFSWYGIENNLYWHSHEWLSEVVIYLTSLIGGEIGVTIFVATCLCVLFVLLYITNKNYYNKNYGFAFLWVILGAFIFSKLLSPRPHMISFILFALTIWILYSYRTNENLKRIWFIPVISFAWVNFHGGSSNLPYILVIIFILTGLFDFKLGQINFDKLSKKQIKNYFIVGALAFLALCLNPHGLDMITYPYANMNDTVMLSFIGEWRSPDIKIFHDIFFVAPIIVSVFIFIKTKKEILFIDLSLIGAFSYLTLKSVRFSAFLYIVACYIIFKYLKAIGNKKFKKKIFNEIIILFPTAIKRIYLVALGSLGIFLVLLITTNPVQELFNNDIISNEIIQTIKDKNPERLYNDYNYGGYLIYKDIKPMIDGRADMYSSTLLEDYIEFAKFLNPKLTERYEFDYLLVDKGYSIDNFFKTKPEDYKKLAEDENCVLYENLNFNK